MVNKDIGIYDVNVFLAFDDFLLGFSNLDRSILSITFNPGVLGGMESIPLVSSIILGTEVSLFKSHFEIKSATKPCRAEPLCKLHLIESMYRNVLCLLPR